MNANKIYFIEPVVEIINLEDRVIVMLGSNNLPYDTNYFEDMKWGENLK